MAMTTSFRLSKASNGFIFENGSEKFISHDGSDIYAFVGSLLTDNLEETETINVTLTINKEEKNDGGFDVGLSDKYKDVPMKIIYICTRNGVSIEKLLSLEEKDLLKLFGTGKKTMNIIKEYKEKKANEEDNRI